MQDIALPKDQKRIKVAHIVNTFPSISETFILNQITGQIDKGVDIHIYAHRSEQTGAVQPDVIKYDLLKKTTIYEAVKSVMPSNIIVRYLTAIYIIITYLHRNPIPLIKALNIFQFGTSAISLHIFFKVLIFFRLKFDQYDVIHAHYGPNGNLAVFLKQCGLVKGKLITTFYGYDLSSYIKSNGPEVYRQLFEYGDIILVLSEEMRRRLLNLGCPNEKVRIHHLGIDPDRFKMIFQKPPDNGIIQITTIARLVEKKGLEYAIRAVAKLKESYPNIKYSIIGDGPLRNTLERLIVESGVHEYVTFEGWKGQEEIISLLSMTDIVLAPSITASNGDSEGTPTVLLEAQARGLPVVSTYHSGIPEIVANNVTGLLVPEKDVEGIVHALDFLQKNPQLRIEFGKEGRNKILKEFNIKILVDRLLQYYN
jgi:colanic acid/amylovoran biosynthesis glycosyltransferase